MLSVGSVANPGNAKIANGWLCVDNNDSCTMGSPAAGGIYSVTAATTGADVAENYPTTDASLEVGDVVAADTGFPVYVSKATSTSPILGIVSTKPGVLLNGYKAKEFANATTVPVALAGRVPVNVSNENGPINIGDYLAPSKTLPGYVMKATRAGFVLGRALESFTASSTSATPNLGSVLIFIQPTQYVPKVADLLQNGANSDDQAWLQSLADLNMTNASVFGDIAVQGSLAVQNDLHVGGIIYAATLNVDTINAKKLCLGQTCVTEDQLKNLLKLLNQQNGIVAGASSPTPTTIVTPPTTDPAATNPAPTDPAATAADPTTPSAPAAPDIITAPAAPAADVPPAATQGQTGDGSALQQSDNSGSGATVSDAAIPPPATGN
jgi:hypothetical protein